MWKLPCLWYRTYTEILNICNVLASPSLCTLKLFSSWSSINRAATVFGFIAGYRVHKKDWTSFNLHSPPTTSEVGITTDLGSQSKGRYTNFRFIVGLASIMPSVRSGIVVKTRASVIVVVAGLAETWVIKLWSARAVLWCHSLQQASLSFFSKYLAHTFIQANTEMPLAGRYGQCEPQT